MRELLPLADSLAVFLVEFRSQIMGFIAIHGHLTLDSRGRVCPTMLFERLGGGGGGGH